MVIWEMLILCKEGSMAKEGTSVIDGSLALTFRTIDKYLRNTYYILATLHGTAYCCHNHADERVLQALMKKFYSPGTSRPQIIVSEFRNEMYDVRHR